MKHEVKFGEVSKMTTPFRRSPCLCGGSVECRVRGVILPYAAGCSESAPGTKDPAHVATRSSLVSSQTLRVCRTLGFLIHSYSGSEPLGRVPWAASTGRKMLCE